MLLAMLLASMSFILEAIAVKVDFPPFRYIDLADFMELWYDPLGHLCWISFLYLWYHRLAEIRWLPSSSLSAVLEHRLYSQSSIIFAIVVSLIVLLVLDLAIVKLLVARCSRMSLLCGSSARGHRTSWAVRSRQLLIVSFLAFQWVSPCLWWLWFSWFRQLNRIKSAWIYHFAAKA